MVIMKRFHALFCVSLFMIVFLLSCKPQVPGRYLQPGEMEDILFDYHVAMGMVSENDTNDFEKRMFAASVFKKYGITEAEFDSSLVYYTRHSDRLLAIYENLSKRLGDEAASLGASVGDISKFGDNASVGDTTNVWQGASSIVLATIVPDNVESFHIVADTAYHKGDKLVFSFDTQFIFQDGYRDGVAVLAVRLLNDSIATRSIHISGSSHYDISFGDDERIGIKDIRGFISLQNSQNSSQTTLKLMFVSNIKLIRCHVNSQAVGTFDNKKLMKSGERTNTVDTSRIGMSENKMKMP